MTNHSRPRPENNFALCKLPWLVAAGSAIIYLLTLNHWVSLDNLSEVAKKSHWSWGSEYYSPLFFLVTYPLHWLPASWVPLCTNLFSMLCGVLILTLLARSVALLPRDRTEDQRLREHSKPSMLSIPAAWMPPVLAAVVCGLQLSFWESATSGANDLFDLLLFAYIVRCLLEFRVNQNESWLMQAALVCGAAMANGWLMFCLFPAFLVALIWMKRLEFFQLQFLSKMFLCGAVGLLFYLVMPLISVFSGDPTSSFWQVLKLNLTLDKNIFIFFAHRLPLSTLLLLSVTSFLPILVIGIRWPSRFGDASRLGTALATWIFHIAHALMLLVCIWVAFNPVFSPAHLGFTIPALYYLASLSVGYMSGYFLLVFRPLPSRMGRSTSFQNWMNQASLVIIPTLLVLTSAALILRNLPQIRITNGPAVKDYANGLIEGLPKRAVILSDDAGKLLLAQAALTRAGTAANYIFLDTQLLKAQEYHTQQARLHPGQWPAIPDLKPGQEIGPFKILGLLLRLSEQEPLFYLHPSFGYYFERFDLNPHGLNYELTPCPTNTLSEPKLTETEIAQNEKLWNSMDSDLTDLVPFISQGSSTTNSSLEKTILQKLHIPFDPNPTAVMLGRYYSQSLDFWGVQMQRAGKLAEARRHFQSAFALNRDNIAAKFNLDLNTNLQAGKTPVLGSLQSLADEVTKYHGLDQMVGQDGPFDDPAHCLGMGIMYANGGLLRQSVRQFERVHDLVPGDVLTRASLARLYVQTRMPEKALTLLSGLDPTSDEVSEAGIRQSELLQTKASALFMTEKQAAGDKLIRETIENHPADFQMLASMVATASKFRRYTNCLFGIDQILRLPSLETTNLAAALTSKGYFDLQIQDYQDAIPALNRAISLESTNNIARLYRAIACLRMDKLDEAQKEYDTLRESFPNSNEIISGLGEIALKRQDTNTAIKYFELCLSNCPAESPQGKFFTKRIESIKTGSP